MSATWATGSPGADDAGDYGDYGEYEEYDPVAYAMERAEVVLDADCLGPSSVCDINFSEFILVRGGPGLAEVAVREYETFSLDQAIMVTESAAAKALRLEGGLARADNERKKRLNAAGMASPRTAMKAAPRQSPRAAPPAASPTASPTASPALQPVPRPSVVSTTSLLLSPALSLPPAADMDGDEDGGGWFAEAVRERASHMIQQLGCRESLDKMCAASLQSWDQLYSHADMRDLNSFLFALLEEDVREPEAWERKQRVCVHPEPEPDPTYCPRAAQTHRISLSGSLREKLQRKKMDGSVAGASGGANGEGDVEDMASREAKRARV